MNYKLKKGLIIGSAVLVPTAIIGGITGAYFATSVPERISQKGIFTIRVNENLNNDGYKYDLSSTYGSPTESNTLSQLINNEILHIKSEGDFQYDQINGKVIKPSFQSLTFANANAVVLTFIDSSINQKDLNEEFFAKNPDKCFQLIFDSDAAEITPKTWGPNDVVVDKDSNDPKSINNKKVFKEIISKGTLAKKPLLDGSVSDVDTSSDKFVLAGLGVTFNTDAYWVDSNGNKTKYNVCAQDMFYSLKRTWLYDTKYRRAHGGSKELDSYFINKTQTTKRFLETSKFPNEYLFDFFGIDKNKLYNESTAIQNVWIDGKPVEAFTFSFNIFDDVDGSVIKDYSYSVNEIIEKYLTNTITMCLAPSQYIKELVNQKGINSTPSGTIEDEAAKYAIYTYGQTRETTLFASTYVPTSSVAGREIYEYNKHYANKKWVDSVEKGAIGEDGKTYKTINKVIIEYTNGIDTTTFINQSFTSFLNGSLSKVDYSQISDAQKQKLYGSGTNIDELIANSQENGLQETKKINISTLTTRMVWQANPISEDGKFTFNDTYSKLVYGSNIQQLQEGNVSTANSFFAGYGFAFRLLIQASINWQTYIQQAYTGTRDVWLSGAAQNARFSSFDYNSKSPFDYADKGINDLIYFDENGNIQVSTIEEMKAVYTMTGEEIQNKYGPDAAQDLQKTKMQAPPTHFKRIQKAMKALLDKFYKENNLSSTEKITWEIAYPFADQNLNKCNATQYLVENVINQIDPRLNAQFFKPTTRDEMLDAINKYRGAYNTNLWGYDYEGIGSFIVAFTSEGGGTNISSAISIFSKDVEKDPDEFFKTQTINGITVHRPSKDVVKKLQSAHPQFTILSKFIRENLNQQFKKPRTITVKMNDGSEVQKTLNTDSKYYVENWDAMTTQNVYRFSSFFNVQTIFDAKQTVYTEEEYKKIESNPWNINPNSALPALFKKFEADAPWELDDSLNEEEKGQKWVDLIKEINSIKGVSIDTESSVDKLASVNYTLFLKEYIIPISKYGVQFYQDIKYEVKK